MVYAVLDVMEEKCVSSDYYFNTYFKTVGTQSSELYLGLLYALEDMAVYGYMTNSRVKFIVVLGMTEQPVRDTDVRVVGFYQGSTSIDIDQYQLDILPLHL